VLIQVEYAGVGSWDPSLVSGEFSDLRKPRFPRVIGSDGEGRVVAVGSRVQRCRAGDRVYGWGFGNPKGGFFAEYAVLSQDKLAAIPENLSPAEAGALAVDGITALEGLEHANLRPGRSVMIFGASGGVGHLALQLATRLRARIFAVASGPDGVELAKRLGAEVAVDGRQEDLVRLAKEFAPQGFHVALVFAGHDGWPKELALVKRGGRIVYPHGVEPEPQGPRGVKLIAYDGEPSPERFTRLNRLIGRGPFHVELGKVYPLEQLPRALHDVKEHHLGKLAVEVKKAG
jgi:NADPH2:quinone reductase